MAKINVNQSPYWDDYNENKKFYRILFRPGRAVQARELNQIQSQIQKQIERVGAHLFEQGAQVLPGSKEGVKYVNNNGFIKIAQSEANLTNTAEQLENFWLGKKIRSTDTPEGIEAEVIGFREADSINEVRLFVRYSAASTSGTNQQFVPGQTVETVEAVPHSAPIAAASYATGLVSSVIVEEGVYFFDGNFILVDEQVLFIAPPDPEVQEDWSENPTADIGLRITETIVTSEEDESLLDNALGSPNFSAPGADRLGIDAVLEQTSLNSDDSDFITLVRVREGTVLARTIRTEYSVLEDTIARRTFDESGDYSVIPFNIQIRDFLRENENNGIHNESEYYYETEAAAQTASVKIFGLAEPGNGSLHPVVTDKWVPGTSYDIFGDETSFIQLCRNRLSIKIDPGKAYVKGYEIDKLSTSIVDVERARTLRFRNLKTVSTPLGQYVFVNNLFGAPTFETYDEIELHSKFIVTPGTSPGAKIGTARVLGVDFFQGINGDPVQGIYKLHLFDIKIDVGQDIAQLKSLYSTAPTFTADCVPKDAQGNDLFFQLQGSVSSAIGKLIGTGTSWKNDSTQRLKEGDVVSVGLGENRKFFTITTNPETDNELNVTPDPNLAPFSGESIYYVAILLQTDSPTSGLIYQLPDDFVFTLRSGQQGSIDTNPVTGIKTVYTSRRVLADAVTPAEPVSGEQEYNLTGTESFEDFSINAYVVINLSDGRWMELLPYISGSPAVGKVEVETLGTQVKFYFNNADKNDEYYIVAPVIHAGGLNAQERAKNLQKGTFIAGTYSGPSVESVGSDVSEISLGKADILRITRVVEAPDYDTTPSNLKVLPAGHKDITGLYILDNGQKDYYYGIGRAFLQPGSARPRGKVRIEFDYFTHGTTGNYFSVDSYSISGAGKQMDYEDIPEYVSANGSVYDLASSIDFRPRVDEPGGISSGFSTLLELPRVNFDCDYHFFEGRIDILYLDRSGVFYVKKGNPDVNPVKAPEPETGMSIYELDLSPYTAGPTNCIPKIVDNRRYTMRDIGKLERRIKNLEFYTSLSLLETETSELKITDALGQEKFKNGFLVDNFRSFNGDISNSEYKAAVSRLESLARPTFIEKNVSLFEKHLLETNPIQLQSLRQNSNYQKTGDLFTLPYEKVTFAEQKKASKVSNVNPYRVFTFTGSLKITPWSDEWRETSTREPLLVVDDSLYEATRNSYGPTGTKVDYDFSALNWTTISSGTPEQIGTRVDQIGHGILEELGVKERRRAKRRGFARVPDGYANAGERVPVGPRNFTSPVFKSDNFLNGTRDTTTITSSFVDGGLSEARSLGSRAVETATIEFMRSRLITFEAKGFMPGARLYAFFDGVDVNEDCGPGDYSHRVQVENGPFAEFTPLTIGQPLICDQLGRLKGFFKIPNTPGKRFRTGDRSFRLTTSPTNQLNPPPASAGEQRYTARGWIDISQETFQQTKLFTIAKESHTVSTEETLRIGETVTVGKSCPSDPIAQSFFVYDTGGCFITDVDVFFYNKPSNGEPIRLEIRPLDDGGLPSNIVLHTVIKDAAQVVTNNIDLVSGTLTVTGNDNSDPLNPPNSNDSGPWPSLEISNESGTNIVSGTPIPLSANPAGDMIPTRFTFTEPIYLNQNESYCIVLISENSDDYLVWVSQFGPDITGREGLPSFRDEGEVNTEIGTTTAIVKDPYIQGIYFKSQNGISWTPDQTIDMKFKIWKAEFDTSVNGEIEFVNEEIAPRPLTLDPLEFKTGSSLVRVLHPNHGMTDEDPKSRVVFYPKFDVSLSGQLTSTGSSTTVTATANTNPNSVLFNSLPAFTTELVPGSVIINPETREVRAVVSITDDSTLEINAPFTLQMTNQTGVLGTSYAFPSGASLAGIDAATLLNYEGFEVELTEMDYYIIDIGTNAIESGRFGGTALCATDNIRFEELMLLTTPLVWPETNIAWNVQTTSSVGPNDSTNFAYEQMARRNLIPNEKLEFDRPMHVSGWINERSAGDTPSGPSSVSSTGLGDKKSLNIRAVLSSNNSNLSPIIDKSRFSVSLLSNRLDDPRGALDVGVDPSSIINSVFDDFTVLPATDAPAVASNAGDLFFTSSTGLLTGTVEAEIGSTTVIGTGTAFLSELKIGDTIRVTSSGEERRVSLLISDTELRTDIAWGTSFGPGQDLYTNPPPMRIKTADANIAKHLSKIDIGKYLTVTGAASTGRNFTDKLVLRVNYTPFGVPDSDVTTMLCEIVVDHKTTENEGTDVNDVTIVQKDRFIDEIAPFGGSCSAKYVSKQLVVPRPSNALKVMFDAHRDPSCRLELYYRLQSNENEDLDNKNWTYSPFNLDTNGAIQETVPAPNEGRRSFSAYESNLIELPSFVSAQVKIVMRGGNPAKSPLIKNFRMIALDE